MNTEKNQTFRYTLYISPLFPRRRKLYTTALRSTTLSSCCPPLTCRVPIKRRGKKVLGGGGKGKLIASLSKIFVVAVSKSGLLYTRRIIFQSLFSPESIFRCIGFFRGDPPLSAKIVFFSLAEGSTQFLAASAIFIYRCRVS